MKLIRTMLLGLCATILSAGEPVLVVHAELEITEIDADTVKKIFTGRDKKWPNDVKVALCLQKKGDVADAFSDTYTGKSAKKLLGHWKKQVFAGKAKMPELLVDDAEVLEWVAENAGAAGYVDSESVGDVAGVTVVTITE